MAEFFELPFKLDFMMSEILLVISSIVVLATCIKLISSRNMLESIIIMSVFSLFISICYLLMDAPDVAMTETALGACLSSCVLINVTNIVGENAGNPPQKMRIILSALLCAAFIACLTLAAIDLPEFGIADSPLQTHLTAHYMENTKKDIAIPSVVAAVLASYRGFDTLGETVVILIAGLAVLVITTRRRKKNA